MGLIDWIKGSAVKTKDPRDNLTDEDREQAVRMRQWKRELAEKKAEMEMTTAELRAKKEQIKLDLEIQKLQQELDDMTEPDEEEVPVAPSANPEDAMAMMLISKFMNPQNPAPVNSMPTQAMSIDKSPTSAGLSLTDEQIDGYMKTVPKHYLKMAKKLDDESLKLQIMNAIPNISAGDIPRIIAKIRQ